MLIIVSRSFTLFEGNYAVKRISQRDAAILIRENSKELVAALPFESTAKVLTKMTGVQMDWETNPTVPPPYPGDKILSVRLLDGVNKKVVYDDLRLDHLDFFLIEYTS